MKVTKMSSDNNDADQKYLEIDNEICSKVRNKLVADLGAKKRTIIKETNNYQECLNKSFLLLTIKMNSEKELEIKLRKNFDNKTVKKVINRLKELNYINDELFASTWIEIKGKSRGSFLIRKELLQKGIDKNIIDCALDNIDPKSELSHAKYLISNKYWPEMTKEQKYHKIGGYLARKGYNYEIIKQVLDEN